MSYFGNINFDLLQLIPLDARRVLEVGCGEGALAAAYRSRNPKVHYTAVEADEASAEKAMTRVDRLLRGNFELLEDSDLPKGGTFDAIVLGDLPEHLRDPDRVLGRLHALLADDGHLILSVPNVSHWTAFFHLMHGRWPAEESGLFDRTHLRFFTISSLIDTMTRGGFRLLKRRPRQFLLDREKAEKWMPALADLAEKMGINRDDFLSRSSTLQYVVVAQKTAQSPPRQMHLQFASFAPNMMDVRTTLPAEYLRSASALFVAHESNKISLPRLPIDMPKILVVQRREPRSDREWLEGLAQLIVAGWVTVYEFDDHPELIAQATGREFNWLTITGSHAAQTSTEMLAAVLRTRNPEVMAFPNAAFSLSPFPQERLHPARIFFGALNRERFSVPVARSLEALLKKYPEVSFEVVHDRAFFDALPTQAKTFHPALPYEEYLAAMERSDIALLPLEGLGGEAFKSDIKWVEAASRGLAVIASPCVYASSIQDGVTGLIAESLNDWSPALERLLAEPELRRSIARAAWSNVADNRMFAYQVESRRAWYADLWDRRAELEERLIARTPDLAKLLA